MKFTYGNKRRRNFPELAAIASLIHHAHRGPHPSQHAPLSSQTTDFPGFAQEQRNATLPGCLTVPVSVLTRLYFQCPNPAGGTGPARAAPSLCWVCAGLSREPGWRSSFPKSPFAYGLGVDKRSLSLLGCQSFTARGVVIYKTELQAEGSATRDRLRYGSLRMGSVKYYTEIPRKALTRD